MQQHTQHTLETVVRENSHSVYGLSAQMIQLEVIQGAVARLMNRIDEITHKGWDKDRGIACLVIEEVRDTVRLIDMGFHPLFKEMSQEVDTLNIHAQELFETVIENESEQSVATATKSNINSKEGWNAFAMEGNIKTFIKEFGREPESFEEVLTYITETVVKVVDKSEENKKASVAVTAATEE
ncbi:hypothetical protein [Lysinibacillus sp. RS5]|uniref:hypothetical protein n=1 Tax=unclassified Lysinibacillus TaxID=2636778 RepID=UPI0035BE74F1